jgi:peptidoglycan/LPS O-acetylase OafA/YrhL
MNPLSPVFAIIIYSIAFITAYLISLKYGIRHGNERYENIDALRGFLGLGVFVCHAHVWFQYLQTGVWDFPKSNLYNHLGRTSVSLFFMITAFLFISKLLNTNEKKFDWKALFISRFFRLAPMYFVSIAILLLIVLTMSHWEISVGVVPFVKQLFCWGTFTILGSPEINGNHYTNIINAWVIWSLPFEWFFYFSLPLISLLVLKTKPSKFYIIVSLIFVICFFKIKGANIQHMLSFMGGGIAPFIIKYGSAKIKYSSWAFSILIVILLGIILQYESIGLTCKFLIIIVFNLIALGNNLFGILKSSTLKFLGEISYSTYLMHGIILFTVMYFCLGFERAAGLSATAYSWAIFIITPIVVLVSFFMYRFIEKPCMLVSSSKPSSDSYRMTA